MKKIITLLMVITMIFSLSACGEPSGQHQDMVSTLDTVSDLQERQPTPTDLDFSLERYNLIRRAYWVNGQREKAAAVVCQVEKPLEWCGTFAWFEQCCSMIWRRILIFHRPSCPPSNAGENLSQIGSSPNCKKNTASGVRKIVLE